MISQPVLFGPCCVQNTPLDLLGMYLFSPKKSTVYIYIIFLPTLLISVCIVAAMATRRCFHAKVFNLQWTGFLNVATRTLQCSYQHGGKSSPDLTLSSQASSPLTCSMYLLDASLGKLESRTQTSQILSNTLA